MLGGGGGAWGGGSVAIERLYIYTSYGIIILGFMYYAWDGSDSIIVLGIV